MEEKEKIDYKKLLNEKFEEFPDTRLTPVEKFMIGVTNILGRTNIASKEEINCLCKFTYEQISNDNLKWKYGNKSSDEIAAEIWSNIFTAVKEKKEDEGKDES